MNGKEWFEIASQKVENLLNLALDATEEERIRSLELEVGYHPIDRMWDLIVKYSGSLERVRELAEQVTELLNEYAIITILESRIDLLSRFSEIEYIEKPKRLFFQITNGKRVSCINPVQQTPFSLYGNGVLLGIVDSGIDYSLRDFRKADGTTKIRYLWDQTIEGSPPVGYARGTEYTRDQINEALQAETSEQRRALVPSVDNTGHGTAVAGIAAAVASESDLIIVKMGQQREEGFPRTTELMLGVDYVIRKALELQMPVAVNLSFGNTYGAHDGTSLVERFLDDISNFWKSVICVGNGNEGTTAGHISGNLIMSEDTEVALGVQRNEPTINVQIWKSYADEVDISIVNPSGVRVGPIQEILGTQRFVLGGTEILLYYGEPSPFSVRQEIFLDFLPRDTYISSGEWRIILTPRRVVSGAYQMWLPVQSALNIGSAFLNPTSTTTLTIPATAGRVISVGAYDALTFTYADFSGRGPIAGFEGTGAFKPDIAAPGVNVVTTAVGGGNVRVSGTSFAVPFVTGSAALLMEWGIVKENDPYLYGEKVKAYLRRGARRLPGFEAWPNNEVGYGALCVRDSLPE